MDNLTIERLARYSDADAAGIGRLRPFLDRTYPDRPVARELLAGIIDSPHHAQLVARMEGRIVGAATLSILMGSATGRIGYLSDFVTDPSVRGQGVGGRLWEETMAWCREKRVDLEFTSSPARQEARAFYLRRGAMVRETTVFRKAGPDSAARLASPAP